MAKVSGSYESLIRGVSEQVAHQRLPGQHWDQENFISDPVRGLARRHGSVMVSEKFLHMGEVSADTLADAVTYKEHSFYLGGVEHSIAYRPGLKPAGSNLPGLICVNKDTGQILDAVTGAGDTLAQQVVNEGISTITTIGRYLLFGSRTVPTTYTTHNALDATKTVSVVWVKGGAYSRTFTVTCYQEGAPAVAVSYTTMPSYYPGTLDTSDISSGASDYQKQVNDRVNAYQTAVNQHISAAAADIQPQAIAEKLRLALVAAGITDVVRKGSHLLITGPVTVSCDDGGDGFLLKAVSQEVESVGDLSPQHMVGKVVRVAPRSSGSSQGVSYYMRADEKAAGQTGLQEVTWRETAGLEVTPGFLFLIGAVVDGVLYVGSSPEELEAVSGLVDVPKYDKSSAGDGESSPVPAFMGKTIAYMRTFQDRLLIVSGAVVYMSRPGDYFNLFRESVLTLADSDPIEVFAEGSEGDVITDSVQMDRSLLLFGRRQQYAIPGREAVVPRNAFIAIQSAHEDTTTAPPIASGNLIFFTQARQARLTVQQMQTGAYADSFDAFEVSTQLDGYMQGTPRQLVAMTSPSMLFVRTQELTNGVYVYSYMDSPSAEQRLFDSWSRWTWHPSLGTLVSLSQHDSSLLTVMVRQGVDGVYLVLDRFSRESQLASAPYLDSRRPYASGGTGSIAPGWAGSGASFVALNSGAGAQFLLGRGLAAVDELFLTAPGTEPHAELGVEFESAFEPTAPVMRDRQEKAILDGRLTLTKLAVTVADSAAMRSTLRAMSAPVSDGQPGLDWVHRQAGLWVLNTQQIADTLTVTVPVMKEVRAFRLRLMSRNWLPLTVASIEWAGQFFTGR